MCVKWPSGIPNFWDSQGHILKFNSQDGSALLWGCIGEMRTVLEWAVQLDKVEPQTFTEFRRHLLFLHKLNQHHLTQRSQKYLRWSMIIGTVCSINIKYIMLIKFDYLILTSKKATLRAFFFFLLRKTPFRFSLRSKFMKLGGPTYKGWAFQGRGVEIFIGHRRYLWQRRNTREFEFIITMPGEICNLFVFDFLKSSNLLRGEWKITRLDLQLTLGYEFGSQEQIMFFYWNFYKNQSALEKRAKKRKVKLTANEEYLLVSVGCKKQERSEWKVYSSELAGNYPKEVNVRFEVTLKTSLQYLNYLGESDGCIERCNFRIIQQTLFEAADTFLLSKHRSLLKNWSSYLKAQKELEKTKAEPILALTAHPTKQEFRPRGSEKPREATSGRRKSRFSEELALVAEALESFAKMVQSKRPTFSHKQVHYLNDQLKTQNWRVSWNRRKQWALVPTEMNPATVRPITKKGEDSGDWERRGGFEVFGRSLEQGCSGVPPITEPQNGLHRGTEGQ